MIRLDDVMVLLGGVCIDKGYGGLVRRSHTGPLELVPTCVRPGATGFSRTRNGVWLRTAADIPRSEYVPGVGTCLLIEPAVENLFEESEDISVGFPPWSVNEVTISATSLTLGPFGAGSPAPFCFDVIESVNNDDHYFQWSGPAHDLADTPHVVEIWARGRGRNWLYIRTVNQDGTTAFTWFDIDAGVVGTSQATHLDAQISDEVVAAGETWRRCTVILDAGSGVTAPSFRFGIATANEGDSYDGDGTSGIAFANPSLYAAGARRSPVVTPAGSTATKSADLFTVPFPIQEIGFQIYVQMVELQATFDDQRVWQVGSIGNADPRLLLQRVTANDRYRVFHSVAGPAVVESILVTPSFGNRVELLVNFFPDGSVQLAERTNGGAVTTTEQSEALMPEPWSDTVLQVGGSGTGSLVGAAAIRAVMVTLGNGHVMERYPRFLEQLQDLAA